MKKDLFENNDCPDKEDGTEPGLLPTASVPLADRMRPQTLDEVVGQDDLLGPDGPLGLLLQGDTLPSLLLWGPPGCGKTTLARLVAQHTHARFLEYSAVSGFKRNQNGDGRGRQIEKGHGSKYHPLPG